MLCTNARPKSISGRTSYHPARLEFHRYPHLIPECCTARGFGPPSRFRGTSSWSWLDRRVSGRFDATNLSPYSGSLSLWLRPRTDLTKQHRNHSSAHSSIGTLSPRKSLRSTGLQLLVSVRFQILFHRPPGLLFSFPSLY